MVMWWLMLSPSQMGLSVELAYSPCASMGSFQFPPAVQKDAY